ncbi:MAG: hypothetical protein J6Y85_05525 [Alphaproteobacteria bacterium]|nr:hypothetical protein [Alphaproteobacteria bacterium]
MHILYNYAPKEIDVLKTGLWAPVCAPRTLLAHYFGRARTRTKKGVLAYLESTCPGRSRAISFLTSPMTGECLYYADFCQDRILYSINFDRLIQDGLVEAIYRSEGKKLIKIMPQDIQWDEVLPWKNVKKGLFFKAIPHYMVVMRDGKIPPEYITHVKN